MIVIKIKTWKDYKKDFLEWLKAPRQSTCIDFAQFMRDYAEARLDVHLGQVLKDLNLPEEHQEQILSTAYTSLREAEEETIELIYKTQPYI